MALAQRTDMAKQPLPSFDLLLPRQRRLKHSGCENPCTMPPIEYT